ncbi:MAG TPA: DUF2225 domain-containing protein [Spirochaetia bacterium]|nr:DUF2225 domain-containing protein [Spirochaetia bacterium]
MEAQKLTFFEKKQTVCPACDGKFYREDLLSGGGRLNAGDLSPELRRLYVPSKKFGEVSPLLYPVTVCPVCYFSAFAQDFDGIPDKSLRKAEMNAEDRHRNVSLLFPELDFTAPRTLLEGAASYFFAMMCYDFYDRKANPTYKAGLCALRAAWLLGDLHEKYPGENWNYASLVFYRKARFYYQMALERESAGLEAFDSSLAFGPDLDKNYGYYGVIYLAAYLEFRYGAGGAQQAGGALLDPEKRASELENARRMMAKIFGVGKSSKEKPAVLLDKAKEIYQQMGDELAQLRPEAAGAELDVGE